MDASAGRLPAAMGRWAGGWLVDTLLGGALAALVVSSVLTRRPAGAYDFAAPNVWLVVLALAASLPIVARRRWPFTVLVVVVATTFAIAALGWDVGDAAFCIMFALYTAAAWRTWPVALAGLLVTYAALGGLAVMRVPYFDSALAVLSFAAMTVAWVVGLVMRRWRRDREAAMARAVAAERARAVAAQRAVFAERLHFARDLHDVVSHTLSVIAVQAGVARYQFADPTSPVGAALTAIEQASRTALDDLRRMLGVMRAEPTGGGDDAELRDPVEEAPPAKSGLVQEWLVDTIVAVALAAFALANAFVDDPAAAFDYPRPTGWLILLVLVASLPLAVRRRWPFMVLVTTAGATFAITMGGWNQDVAGLCSYIALYTVAAWCRLPVAALGLVVLLVAEAVPVLAGAPHVTYTDDLAGLGLLVPWGVGLIVRRWRADKERARVRTMEAERTRAVVAERAVFAERVRIARELHDVISHTLSVIAVQSGVARHQLGESAGTTTTALRNIEEASRAALDDLRRMLGVLQESDGEGAATLRPSPAAADLELLASAHRATYGPVQLVVDPALRSTPQTVQMTAYRLVQEALTNVRKHAPGSPARVSVSAGDGLVVIQVDDDGPTHPAAAVTRNHDLSLGYGLAGMRERVALFDGGLQAGPRPGGGFRIRAVLSTTERTPAA